MQISKTVAEEVPQLPLTLRVLLVWFNPWKRRPDLKSLTDRIAQTLLNIKSSLVHLDIGNWFCILISLTSCEVFCITVSIPFSPPCLLDSDTGSSNLSVFTASLYNLFLCQHQLLGEVIFFFYLLLACSMMKKSGK